MLVIWLLTRDIDIECSKQFKWNFCFYVSGQSRPFWAALKLLWNSNMKLKRHFNLWDRIQKWKVIEITHELNHDLAFYCTHNCVCHSINSMFRVLGNFAFYMKYMSIFAKIWKTMYLCRSDIDLFYTTFCALKGRH